MGSIRVSDGIVVEFGTPEEGAEIIANLLDKVKGSSSLSKKFSRNRLVKSLHEEPAIGTRMKSYRDRAFEYLKQRGSPTRLSIICTACGIPSGSSTTVFKDSRFEKTPDGLMWLSPEGVGMSKSTTVVKTTERVAELREQIRVFLLAYGRPCYPKKILRHLRLEVYGQDYYFLFRHEMFTQEGGLVWLRGQFWDDVGDNKEDPAEKEFTEEELEMCRDKLFTHLSACTDPQKPAVIAAAIGMEHYLVTAALNHEWFTKTVVKSINAEQGVEGYVIAKRRKPHGGFRR